ncbi:hypothetical protein S100072_03230 [Bacillus velezensis]|nr:hypothetical protein S100072_03230 [Bacillus velezensis]ASB66964.1 hypothetical protein S101413_03547 [Bacillus velezensis]ODS08314.1 hypothetical protein BSHJ18_02748 [Bacillus velezensis]
MFEIPINFTYQLPERCEFRTIKNNLHSTGKAPIPYQGEFGYSN